MLQGMPEDAQPIVRSMMMTSSVIARRSSPEMEIASRLTPEQMSRIIDAQQEDARLHYADEKSKRLYYLLFGILGVGAFIGAIFLLRGNPEALQDTLKTMVPLIVGLAGGIGIGRGTKK